MILIFDLDDTLYPEEDFVKSGFSEVAKLFQEKYGFSYIKTFNSLVDILSAHGRGKVFDIFLTQENIYSKKLVSKCIARYRSHTPTIKLYSEAEKFLKHSKHSLYIVTDGNKLVQKNKIQALGITKYFKKIFVTHNYGINSAKPSLYCFDKIRKLENCNWSSLLYVGDNPTKDFVGLNKKGAATVRLLMGSHQTVEVPVGFDAKIKVSSWVSLNKFLASIGK
jgi:putative hydrolase of the HAD superfamily